MPEKPEGSIGWWRVLEIHNEQGKCDSPGRLFIVYFYHDLSLKVPTKK